MNGFGNMLLPAGDVRIRFAVGVSIEVIAVGDIQAVCPGAL